MYCWSGSVGTEMGTYCDDVEEAGDEGEDAGCEDYAPEC